MMEIFDKRQRAAQLRTRLAQAMEQAGINQSALARAIGTDRSTISQILKGDGTRMPNAQIVAETARVLGISADWLLGLTQRPESAAEIMAESLLMTDAPRALIDEKLVSWHHEAAGYKVRHVPAALPDMLKTDALLNWEYAPHLGRTTDQAIQTAKEHLDWMRSSGSDYEIAIPLHELENFASGSGYYAGLNKEQRREGIEHMIDLHEQLFPTLRVFLFDAHRVFSSPVTIFGPLLAAIYLGRNYVVFRDTERVRAIAGHFDWLIREAEVSARTFPDHLTQVATRNGL